MIVALIAVGWALSMLGALAVGFHWSKRVPHRRTLSAEVLRRLRVLSVYAKATLAVIVPAYRRRWDRKRAEARRAYAASLVPIECSFTKQS